MRNKGMTRRARRAVVIGAVLIAGVTGSAGPAAADCDLAELGRSGMAPSGTTVLVDGLNYLCVKDQWFG